MGKCKVVVDIGFGLTKIAAFRKTAGKYELFSGALFDTPDTGLSEPETLQNLALHLEKLAVKSGDMHVILPVDEKTTVCAEAEYPTGSAKDVSAIIKNNLSGILPDDESLFSHSWRILEKYPSGQGKYQIAATRTEIMERLYEATEKSKMNLKTADITGNAVENLAGVLRYDRKYGISSAEDAIVLVDVGYKTAHIVVVGKEKIIGMNVVSHNLYRLDKIILSSSPELKKDPNIIPELLKFNSSFTSKISQYGGFIDYLTTEIIRCIKQTVSGENRYHLTTIYFTGGMFKVPTLVSTIKDSFGVPCFAFPMSDFMQLNEGCIIRPNRKASPTADLFATSLGALLGGD